MLATSSCSAAHRLLVRTDEVEDDQTCSLREAVTAANDDVDFGGCDGDATGADLIVLQGGVEAEAVGRAAKM